MADDQKTLDLLFESQSLKRIPRSGWLIRAAPRESLADHSFGAAMVAIVLSRMEGLSENDEASLVRRALLHDLHEARVGDLSKLARKYVVSDEKRAEKEMLSGTSLESEIKLLTGEKLALLTHDCDKLDMLFQAVEYANAGNKNMGEFVESALSQIKSKSGKRLARLALAKLKK
jgi:putative hydrolase of HD superfamily